MKLLLVCAALTLFGTGARAQEVKVNPSYKVSKSADSTRPYQDSTQVVSGKFLRSERLFFKKKSGRVFKGWMESYTKALSSWATPAPLQRWTR